MPRAWQMSSWWPCHPQGQQVRFSYPALFGFRHDLVYIDGRFGWTATAGDFAACVQSNVQGIESAEHKAKLGTCVTVFDFDHPSAADADSLGEVRLIEFELLAPVSYDGAQIGGCTNQHEDSNVIIR